MPKNTLPPQPPQPDYRLSNKLHLELDGLVHSLIRHDIDLQFAKKQLERAYIQALLRINHNNIGQTARALGVHRNTLSKHMKELKIIIERA